MPSPATTSAPDQAPARFFAILKRTRTEKTRRLHQQRLQFLAQNFDPFVGEPSEECAQILAFYKLDENLDNPFEFTNALLVMLDAVEDALKS